MLAVRAGAFLLGTELFAAEAQLLLLLLWVLASEPPFSFAEFMTL